MARHPPTGPSSAGATGPDVAELNADLVALGYAHPSSAQPELRRRSGSATTTAVEKLQAALGVTQTGTLTLGQAVFEPDRGAGDERCQR